MGRQPGRLGNDGHDVVQEQFDEARIDGRYEEGMARMALYHRHCQDPVIFRALGEGGYFVTMIANPEFDLGAHDPADSKAKLAYSFSYAEPGNGGLMRFHPGGFEEEREPFISDEGLETYGAAFFENYLANPQS